MNARTPPPRGLRWTDTNTARIGAQFLAVLSLLVSLYCGWRYVGYVDCLRDSSAADQRRTSAIAAATDAERRADLALVQGPRESALTAAELRAADIAARQHTDAVRAANPAPPPTACS